MKISEIDREYLEVIEKLQEVSEKFLKSEDLETREELHEEMKGLIQKAKEFEIKEELEEFIRSSGAIALKNQEIKIHKNGAKITIPQSYLKDGLLNEKKKYTLVFIPS